MKRKREEKGRDGTEKIVKKKGIKGHGRGVKKK